MKLIVTHEQPDFDALAGLALARLAHPGAIAVMGGDMPDNLRAFLHLYRDELDLRDPEEVDLSGVVELVVVDTNDPARLGRFGELLGIVTVTVYDHHPRHEGEIKAAHGIQERVGATATLLTRHLEASSIEIPAQVASLALLGIHEDTGNLSFDLTTADDYQAAAVLMRRGASLEVVREFQSEFVDRDQRELLREVLKNAETHKLSGFTVAVSAFEYPRYVRHAAGTCNRLLSQSGTDAAILAVRMEGKTLLFARSARGFDVGAALDDAFGGGGHPGAAFARSETGPKQAAEDALAALAAHVQPALTAREIMSSPVRSVAPDTLLHEAQRLLSQYGHNGAPVLEDGKLVGIISRRDLERALRHDLSRSNVSGFMTKEVISAGPEATLMDLERLVQEHNIGRIPILEGGDLTGIVTRSDLLAAHHPPREPHEAREVYERLPSEARAVLDLAVAGLKASDEEAALYLVGGTVRDALLGRALVDLDVVIEGGVVEGGVVEGGVAEGGVVEGGAVERRMVEGAAAETLVGRLQRRLGGSMTFHAAFGTSTLNLASGLAVDVAGAREEFYAHPGALPQVTPSSIKKDLARRDFTVNALAVRLTPEPLQLLDPFEGMRDLGRKILRPLHPLSFVEDPTRILRGARLAGRLGFQFAESAKEQAAEALDKDVLAKVSGSRLRSELELTFAEPHVNPALRVLESLGALGAVYRLEYDADLPGKLDELRAHEEIPDLAYLHALLLRNSFGRAAAHVEEFNWPRRMLAIRESLEKAEVDDYVSDEWLDAADDAQRAVTKVLSPTLAASVKAFEEVPRRRKVRGRDVLELGLPPGPEVGEVLASIARARQHGRVKSFEEELELARRRVEELLGRRTRE